MITRMLSKVLLGVTLTMGVGGYIFYKDTQGTIQNLQAEIQSQQNIINGFELRQEEQINTIESLQDNLDTTTRNLNQLVERNNEIESEMNRYLDIFARHDLSRLAAAKPGLIEIRINKGTQDVFNTIENDTTDIGGVPDQRMR